MHFSLRAQLVFEQDPAIKVIYFKLKKCLKIGLKIQNPVYCKTYVCVCFYRLPEGAVYYKPHGCLYFYRIPPSAASFIS